MSGQVRLIVAEKPSQAKDYASALGARWNDSIKAYEAPGYRIINLKGHVLSLKGLKELDSRFTGAWDETTLSFLPVFPKLDDPSCFVPTERELVSNAKRHMNDSNVSAVICGCDPGREGDLLFWEVYNFVRCSKPVFRVWESEALSKDVVLRALQNLKGRDFYEPRKRAAYARQQADWLVGMNLTTAYSSAVGTLYTVGPVQTPTLAMVVHRDELIEMWAPLPYAEVSIRPEGFMAKLRPDTPKFPDRPYSLDVDDAERYINHLSPYKHATVQNIEHEAMKVLPPLLYSLTTLQIEASKKYNFSASTTLRIAQKLYDEYKCLSYPRTDSEVIGESMTHEARDIAKRLSIHYGIPYGDLYFTKRNVNNAELTDHHAILALKPLPDGASEQERQLYELVLRRFFQAFGPEGLDQRAVVTLSIGECLFEARGRIQSDLGWRELVREPEAPSDDDNEDEDALTPALFKLTEKQVLRLTGQPTMERKTIEAPKHFTVATLLSAMKNIANSIDDPALRKAVIEAKGGLGTPATRAGIIDLLFRRGYLVHKGRRVMSTPLGRALVHTVSQELRNYRQRAQMEELLNDYETPNAYETYLANTMELVQKSVEQCKTLNPSTALPKVGVSCPRCQSELLNGGRGYKCEKCDFQLPKSYAGYTFTVKDLQALTTAGQTDVLKLMSRKSEKPKPYSARIVMDANNSLSITFPKDDDLALGPCPLCSDGQMIPKTPKNCTCNKCGYVLWREVAGVNLTDSQMKRLLTKKQIPKVKGFKKRGQSDGDKPTTFEAGLILDAEGKVKFQKAT